jgi:Replication initiator protein, pSAM2
VIITDTTLAPEPGSTPGPGANAASGTFPGFPGIYDPWRILAADSAFIRASDGFLVTREYPNQPERPPDHFAAADLFPDVYDRWLDHVWPAAACAHPIRLTGSLNKIDAGTGEVLSTVSTEDLPDRVIYKACGNRRAGSCPACAETYRRDAFHIIRSGLIGGKGVSPAVATHPATFATFTAPSFGPVHTRPVRRHTCASRAACRCQPEPCHARHDAQTCPHGRPLVCWRRHRTGDPELGQPLCLECYDHAGQVVWNHYAGELWRRTKQAIERRLGQRGLFVWVRHGKGRRRVPLIRLSHGKAAEYQHRGMVHFHALLRLDGYHPADPDAVLPPPPGITVADLEDATRHAAHITCTTPGHKKQPDGWRLTWGGQIDVRIISMRGSATVTDLMVASYLAKYATKGTKVTGHASARITPDTVDLYASATGGHAERLIHACWVLGQDRAWWKLRRWAHMLGFGGQFFTKSDHYSLRFADLRQARITYRRQHDPGPEPSPIRTADHTDDETTLIVGTLSYAGTGWKTTGDALLANTAADQARKRHEAGREELTHEYNSTNIGQQAA